MKIQTINHRDTIIKGSCLTAVLLALSTVAPLAAEDTANTEKVVLDEVIVTARRQSESLQLVPLAVSAFNADELFSNRIENLGDLQSHVPNLSLHVGDAANAVIYLRGIGQIDSISFNDPGVGVYVDDVYMGRAQGSFLDVMDPARIEVLRGPQGTLYGRNTIGGAVKFISSRPTNDVVGYLEAVYGNYNQFRAKASISGPIIEDILTAKAAVAHSSRDGYTQNLFDGEDDFDKETNSWRVSALLTPNEDLSFYLVLDGSRNTPDHSRTPHKETPIFSLVSGAFINPTDDPFVVNVNYNNLEKLKTFGVALTAEYNMDELTFKSITSYRKMDYQTKTDLDGTVDASFGIYYFDDQDQFSQELQFIYEGDKISLVSGLYYYKENTVNTGGANAPVFFFVSIGRWDQTSTSKAAYAHLKYSATEALTLSLGARYTREDKDIISDGEHFFGTGINTAEEMVAAFGTGIGFNVTGYTGEADWESFSPKFGLDYVVNEDVMVYANISRGFKSGGFNGRAATSQPYDPENLWSYEVGFKSTFADQRVRLNMAAFYNDYNDFQVSRFTADEFGNFLSVFDNAGKAIMWGVEAELTALLADNLTLNANAGYLNSEYRDFFDGGIDVSEQRHLVNAPSFSSRASLTYDQELGNAGNLSFNGAISYRSKTYLTVSSSEILAQDAYALLEASIRFTSADQLWDVILAGQNLTNKQYREHGFDLTDFPGVQLGYYGTPRTYSVTVRYSF
ncbi:MAG: TonB-dependent receptor [Emcibacter sp.]|nr:TonB-dependent receptor [Emcibacter sp.]